MEKFCLEKVCRDLSSPKVTTRKAACEYLQEHLRRNVIVEHLTEETDRWNTLLEAITDCMFKDNDKALEDSRKKANSAYIRILSADIFTLFVRQSLKEKVLDYSALLDFLMSWLKDHSKRFFHDTFLKIVETLLEIASIRSLLKDSDWKSWYLLLKSLCQNKTENEQFKCLSVVIRVGTMDKFPTEILQNEFNFMNELVSSLKPNSPKPLQDSIIELLINFYKHTVKENRAKCCQLGETNFQNLITLYQQSANEELKSNLIDFFLMLVVLHHPKGVPQGHPAAFAIDWKFWKTSLNTISDLLKYEIEINTNRTIQNQAIFKTKNTISSLSESFVQLFIQTNRQLALEQRTTDEPQNKRQKCGTIATHLIDMIKTGSWVWLNLTHALLETYPDIMTDSELIELFSILVGLEVKSQTVLHHLIKVYVALLKIPIDGVGWSKIEKFALKNNEHESINELLQLLLEKNYIKQPDVLLQLLGGSVSVNTNNIRTLNVVFQRFPYLQNNKELKLEKISWILHVISAEFCSNEMALTLVAMVMKQWPHCDDVTPSTLRQFQDVEDVYHKLSFQSLITTNLDLVTNEKWVGHSDDELLTRLSQMLMNLLNGLETKSHLVQWFNVIQLIFHVLCYLVKFDVYDDGSLETCQLFLCLKQTLNKFLPCLDFEKKENSVKKLKRYVMFLRDLLDNKITDVVAIKIKKLVPETSLSQLFRLLNSSLSEHDKLEVLALKELIIETLIIFSCDVRSLAIQEKALQALCNFPYDYNNDDLAKLALCVLSSVKKHCPTEMSEESLSNVYHLFREVCVAKYYCSATCVQLLEVWQVLYPRSGSDTWRRSFVEILYPFYVKRATFTQAAVMLNLVKCMALVNEFKWKNSDIIVYVPEFLNSYYQEVRFVAIETIANFFKNSAFSRQQIVFLKIKEFCETLEHTVRFSTVLHTYAALMLVADFWVPDALFYLMTQQTADLTQTINVIGMVAQSLGYQSCLEFLEHNVVGLVNRFDSFENFPIGFFQCDLLIEFFAKYWKIFPHIGLQRDENFFNLVSTYLEISEQDLIEITFPRLLSYIIAQDIKQLVEISSNKIYKEICKLPKTKVQELTQTKIDEILLNLLEFVCDQADFKNKFDKDIVFSKKEIELTVDDFTSCILYLRDTFNENLIQDLVKKNPHYTHLLFLQLKLKITRMKTANEQLTVFHHFCILTEKILESLTVPPHYFIRDVVLSLLHYIKNYRHRLELSEASLKFFKQIFDRIKSSLLEHFTVIVSGLIRVALESLELRALCVSLLETFSSNSDIFIAEMKKMHYVSQFANISEETSDLETEIANFLLLVKTTENSEECEENLTQIYKQLSEQKLQLKQMLVDLRSTRGFSETCESSHLHQLLSTLITLSRSTNQRMRMQAVKCLGEIGPADLATLILQPEEPLPDPKWSPWELALDCAITCLDKYLIDGDTKVAKMASDALFAISDVRDARKVVKNELFEHLVPFVCRPASTAHFDLDINADVLVEKLNDDDLWIPEVGSHDNWIKKLVCALLSCFKNQEFFGKLVNVAELKVEFCERIIPFLINTIAHLNVQFYTRIISNQISCFFTLHWDIIIGNQAKQSITTNKSSVQCMLNIVHFVRLQRQIRKNVIHDFQLDYLKIASAAHFCTAYFTSLLYAELWCQEQIELAPNDYCLSTATFTKLDLIYEKVDPVTAKALQKILRESYKAVGENDALVGCGTFHLLDSETRIEHYRDLGRSDLIRLHYEQAVAMGDGDALPALVDILKDSNMYQMSLLCQHQSNYEAMWRLCQWSDDKSADVTATYDRCQFNAIKALYDKDDYVFGKMVDEGRGYLADEFRDANMESIKKFYATFVKLQALQELEDFKKALEEGAVRELVERWAIKDDIVGNDFQFVEPIQALRTVLLTNILKSRGASHGLDDLIGETILRYAECARLEGKTNIAFQLLKKFRLLNSSNDTLAKMRLEEAQLCWKIDDNASARVILKHLESDENVNPKLHALALKMTGQWMVESSSENRHIIIDDYFHKSLDFMKQCERNDDNDRVILDTYYQLAQFTDREYQVLMTYIKSDTFQKKKQHMLKAKASLSNLQATSIVTKDAKKAYTIKLKQSCIDENEILNIETEKNNLLKLALKYYRLILYNSDIYDMTVFRLFSLLLENRDNDQIQTIFEKDLLKIPTYKFITILPQIIPHISSTSCDLFNQSINKLIEKCAMDHPYHTLPLILSLSLSNKDREYSESKAIANDNRTQSAKSILTNLEKSPKLKSRIGKMEQLSEAVIELAYTVSEGGDGRKIKVPRKAKIRNINNFDEVLLPTFNLPVDKTGHYNNIVGVAHFSDVYFNVGGINAPKRISCQGTDGIIRTQLIKGQDDLRQDAVMQQVFNIINSLLAVNKQTKNLRIRTYRIVPLSMRSGILEWVDNTMPIAEYLTGEKRDGGAHVKYRPMDKTPYKCFQELKSLANKTNTEKIAGFKKICENIKPVFHKFFDTNFLQPSVWYEKRRTYIHSVATSSMCGYVLGIGDRHVNNILIDKSTAEVVHIDFGIAFEQGRVLPTPETVPFRLTRDIVDGMGVAGVEGVFRRSCEKTMDLLRRNHSTILTILEVLLYDPLYDWTLSDAEATKRQQEPDEKFNLTLSSPDEELRDVNETAERALLRLRTKLLGMETGKSMSVEHQVGTLIQQAMDPSNLSRLYYGWQPYL